MSSKLFAVIPRFLLPAHQYPRLRRHPLRHASTTPPTPIPLAKPEKFTPPSHGSKLRAPPKITHYGGVPSAAELAARSRAAYPHSMPRPGTVAHYFLHAKLMHMWISLGTLATLALYSVYISWQTDEVFMRKYGDLLPRLSDVFWHPLVFWRGVARVVRLREEERTAETKAKRARLVDDVRKRSQYRKAHGLETEAFGSWTWKGEEKEEGLRGAVEGGDDGGSGVGESRAGEGKGEAGEGEGRAEEGTAKKKSRYNFLGIF